LYGPSSNAWSVSSRIDVEYCSKMSLIANCIPGKKHRPRPILRHRRNGIKSCFSVADQLKVIIANIGRWRDYSDIHPHKLPPVSNSPVLVAEYVGDKLTPKHHDAGNKRHVHPILSLTLCTFECLVDYSSVKHSLTLLY